MLTLANNHLRVDLLEPIADRARLGPRFCWGGFIWQVNDSRLGPLLSGPEWPSPTPSAWNGQGLPESFRHRTRTGTPLTWNADRGVALGAGELALNAAGEPEVVNPCTWQINSQPSQINFHTRQQAAGFDYELIRRIELNERTVVSFSELTNHSKNPLYLEWFAHPFFSLTDRLIRAELPEGATLAENPGFEVSGRELTQKRRFIPDKGGHMDFLSLARGKNLTAQLSHPLIGKIDFECSFAPSECIIWGNSNTFSIEPYQLLTLAPGQTMQWNLRYVFGAGTAT
jgi:hypothetical protein